MSASMKVEPNAALLAQIVEPELRAAPGVLAKGAPMRLAVVRVNNASGLSFADLYVSRLRFNGKSVAENGESFRQIVVTDDDKAADLGRAASEVAAFRPHVVINAGGGIQLLEEVERAWPERERFRPRYMLGPVGGPEMRRLVAARPDVRRRILGVDTAAGTAVNAKYVLRYNEVFSPKITAQEGTFAPYDAFYALAYAAAALGDQPITGLGLAGAIRRLVPPGERVEVGPAGIYPAFHALGSGKSIDLDGTTTTLDFDPETGDATASFSVYCVAPGGISADSGVVYDGSARKLSGTLHCP